MLEGLSVNFFKIFIASAMPSLHPATHQNLEEQISENCRRQSPIPLKVSCSLIFAHFFCCSSKFSFPSVVALAIPIMYSDFLRDKPTRINFFWIRANYISGYGKVFFLSLVHIASATFRDICCPIIIRVRVSNDAGIFLSSG